MSQFPSWLIVTLTDHVSVLNNSSSHPGEKLVRINGLTTGLTEDDLKAVLQANTIDGIVIPKVQKPEDIHHVIKLCEKFGKGKDLRIVASIESAFAMMHLKEVRSDPSPFRMAF